MTLVYRHLHASASCGTGRVCSPSLLLPFSFTMPSFLLHYDFNHIFLIYLLDLFSISSYFGVSNAGTAPQRARRRWSDRHEDACTVVRRSGLDSARHATELDQLSVQRQEPSSRNGAACSHRRSIQAEFFHEIWPLSSPGLQAAYKDLFQMWLALGHSWRAMSHNHFDST